MIRCRKRLIRLEVREKTAELRLLEGDPMPALFNGKDVFLEPGKSAVGGNMTNSSWKNIADKEGVYFDAEINHQLSCVGRMESLEIVLRKSGKIYSSEEKQALAEEKNNIYKNLTATITEDALLPG
jgi:hypothetical protein